MTKYLVFTLTALALTSSMALAQMQPGMMQKTDPHAGHTMKSSTDSEATKAFKAVDDAMHSTMGRYTNDADQDFIRNMIPHHQGAVDAAKIVLKYGKDEEVKKFATSIIKAQEDEIAFMTKWLEKNKK